MAGGVGFPAGPFPGADTCPGCDWPILLLSQIAPPALTGCPGNKAWHRAPAGQGGGCRGPGPQGGVPGSEKPAPLPIGFSQGLKPLPACEWPPTDSQGPERPAEKASWRVWGWGADLGVQGGSLLSRTQSPGLLTWPEGRWWGSGGTPRGPPPVRLCAWPPASPVSGRPGASVGVAVTPSHSLRFQPGGLSGGPAPGSPAFAASLACRGAHASVWPGAGSGRGTGTLTHPGLCLALAVPANGVIPRPTHPSARTPGLLPSRTPQTVTEPEPVAGRPAPRPLPSPGLSLPRGHELTRVPARPRARGRLGLDGVLGGLADQAPGPRPVDGPVGWAQLPAHEAEAGPPSPHAGRSPPGLCGLSGASACQGPVHPPAEAGAHSGGPQLEGVGEGVGAAQARPGGPRETARPALSPCWAGRVGRGLRAYSPDPSESPHTQSCLLRGMAAPRPPRTPGRAGNGGRPRRHLHPSPVSHPSPPTSTRSG